MQEEWPIISRKLQETLDSGVHKLWIAPLRGNLRGDVLILHAPSAFVADWVRTRLQERIRAAAAEVLGRAPESLVLDVRFGRMEEEDAAPAPAPSARPAPRRAAAPSSRAPAGMPLLLTGLGPQPAPAAPLPPVVAPDTPAPRMEHGALPLTHAVPFARSRMEWRHSFEDFVIGPSNNVAAAAAQDICRGAGSCVSTLFISAAPGLGKTHVTQSVGQAMHLAGLDDRVGYLTAEEFAARFVDALRKKGAELEEFKARLRRLDVLLLEDVHFLRGKEKMQETVLGIVKHLQNYGGRVIFTSTFSPRELQQVDPQLVSHFCSGIVSSISRPDEDMRREILSRKARGWETPLSDSVCDLLASRLQGDVRQLESCLHSLVFKARLLRCDISTDLALEALSQYAATEGSLDFETIVRLVCEIFGLTQKQLGAASRRKDLVLARNTAYYLARRHTDMSLADIGARFNRRHTTVIKGITSVEREMSAESREGRQIANAVGLIERRAGASSPAPAA